MKSHTNIAKEMGLTRQAVDAWFSGRSHPNFTNLGKLARSLDMGIEDTVKLLKGDKKFDSNKDRGV